MASSNTNLRSQIGACPLGLRAPGELTGREILLKPKASSNFAFLGTLVGLNLLGSSSHSQSLSDHENVPFKEAQPAVKGTVRKGRPLLVPKP